MIPGAVQRFYGTYLTAEKTPENLTNDTLDEDYATSHHLKWGPLPLNEVGRIAEYVREGELIF